MTTVTPKPVAVPPSWRRAADHLRKAQEAEVRARWAAAMQDGVGASARLREAAEELRMAAEGMERASEVVAAGCYEEATEGDIP